MYEKTLWWQVGPDVEKGSRTRGLGSSCAVTEFRVQGFSEACSRSIPRTLSEYSLFDNLGFQ